MYILVAAILTRERTALQRKPLLSWGRVSQWASMKTFTWRGCKVPTWRMKLPSNALGSDFDDVNITKFFMEHFYELTHKRPREICLILMILISFTLFLRLITSVNSPIDPLQMYIIKQTEITFLSSFTSFGGSYKVCLSFYSMIVSYNKNKLSFWRKN